MPGGSALQAGCGRVQVRSGAHLVDLLARLLAAAAGALLLARLARPSTATPIISQNSPRSSRRGLACEEHHPATKPSPCVRPQAGHK